MKQMLKYILAVVTENLKFAESKHSFIIAINSGIIVVVTSFFMQNSGFYAVLIWFVLVFCGMSIFLSFIGLHARNILIKSKAKINKADNLLYYKDISKYSETEYLKSIIMQYEFPKDYQVDGFEIDLSKQIITSSKLSKIKFDLFNKSVFCLAVGLFSCLLLITMLGFKL